MIQRVQTLYMVFSAIVTGALPFVFELWSVQTEAKTTAVFASASPIFLVLLGCATVLALWSVFSFKKRQNQFVLNRLNMIFNFILLGFFVYRSLNLSGGTFVPEKGIGMFLPAISIVLLVLANKAIKKDEDLVKSVDRLR